MPAAAHEGMEEGQGPLGGYRGSGGGLASAEQRAAVGGAVQSTNTTQ
jgi:hypothetical protein